jgi:uroporphyrinogen decarboxylase
MNLEIEDINLERILKTVKMEEPDQVPIDLYTDGAYLAPFIGIREREYYTNPTKQLEAGLAYLKRFCKKYNTHWIYHLPRPDYSLTPEASGLGCVIRWPEDATPYPKKVIHRPEDIDDLQVPDPKRDGLMPFVLDTIEYMRNKLKGTKFYYYVGTQSLRGAPTLAAELRGIEEFMADIHFNKDLAHKLLKVCTETIIKFAHAMKEILGEDFWFTINDDISGFMSLKQFEEFSLPYNRRIFEQFPKSPLNTYHNNSNTNQILDGIAKLGATIFSPGPPGSLDLSLAKEKLRGKVCIDGNVDCQKVLLYGTPKDVEKAVKECIRVAAPGGGYIAGISGSIARGTPAENIDAFVRAVEKYGRYPIKI